MLQNNKTIANSSDYYSLYEKIIPESNFLRQVKENIDFSFINKQVEYSYSKEMGRPAKEPELMLKLLFLQILYDLSDREVVERARVDMSFKYFLDLMPEEEVVDASLLSKFRRIRLGNDAVLEKILSEIVQQAKSHNILKSKAIIVDATHSKSRGKKETPLQILKKKQKT